MRGEVNDSIHQESNGAHGGRGAKRLLAPLAFANGAMNKARAMTLPPFHLAFPVDDLAAARAFYGGAARLPGRAQRRPVGRFRFLRPPDRRPSRAGRGAARGATNPVDGEEVPVPHFGLVLAMDGMEGAGGAAARRRASNSSSPPTVRFAGQPGEQATMFFLDPGRQCAGDSRRWPTRPNCSRRLSSAAGACASGAWRRTR